ncbi:MAG: peptidoglycan editing factor PgeF [Acidobacteriota bacterium]|nr:peptidoglycan editing factor PgeF [Acidobacteriota bacterium]
MKVLACRALEEKGFVNGFSTRLGGVSPMPENDLNLSGFDDDSEENIMENRRRFLDVFGGDYTLATAWQVHGDDVKTVGSLADAKDGNARFDALVSNLPAILVGVKTADCVPVLIGDAKTKSFAAIHAGWRGTVQSIAAKAVEKMRAGYGANPRDLICAIGPAAVCNYEIGQDVIDAFSENFPDDSRRRHLFTPTRDGHAFVDLHRANFEQLTTAGVSPENIYTAPFCTLERTDLFFSYRKEKRLYGKTGRLLSVIGRK